LSDLKRTQINILNWYYLVDKPEPQGFGRIEDLSRDRQRERSSPAYNRRNRVEEHEAPKAHADSSKAEGCVFGRYHHVAVGDSSVKHVDQLVAEFAVKRIALTGAVQPDAQYRPS